MVDSTVCSRLTSLDLLACSRELTEKILSWTLPAAGPNRNLTSLNVSRCIFMAVHPLRRFKLHGLRRLQLTFSWLPEGYILQWFCNLKSLEWLELTDCKNVVGKDLLELSNLVGSTLRHLSLSGLRKITDAHLRDLERVLPVLRTLDLSECEQISDAILVEWFIKDGDKRWPKLRRLVLKGCERITKEVVDSVRLKTRNQLQIEFPGNKSPL